MAPVDEHIAQARLERKKSMDQPKIAQVAEKVAYDQQTIGGIASQNPYRPPTLAEQAEKSAQYHLDEHVKAQNASYFLTAHPEFEEFIKLMRSGAISFIVLALVAVSALAQAKPEPALSTAERTAIQALEKQKQDTQQQYMQAQQAEQTIEREFAVEHAGYRINPMTFTVEKDIKTATPPAAPEKK